MDEREADLIFMGSLWDRYFLAVIGVLVWFRFWQSDRKVWRFLKNLNWLDYGLILLFD
jgi:hypothetical protein